MKSEFLQSSRGVGVRLLARSGRFVRGAEPVLYPFEKPGTRSAVERKKTACEIEPSRVLERAKDVETGRRLFFRDPSSQRIEAEPTYLIRIIPKRGGHMGARSE